MKRREARQKALQALFEIDLGKTDAQDAIRHVMEDIEIQRTTEESEYYRWLVSGTTEHLDDVDSLLAKCLEGWKLNRLARVDLNVLRLAAFELLYERDVDIATVCNEAVELAKYFSTSESGKFVNGVLARLVPEISHHRDSEALLDSPGQE